MRKLVYYIATSIDGFIAKEDGSVADFLMEGEHATDFLQQLKQFDTVIMGANTYEFGFQYGLKPGEPAYPGLKHIIVSSHLSFEDSIQVVRWRANVPDRIRDLKQTTGKDIWLCGGGNLAGQLLAANLIDELILKVNPIILGQGIPLFGQVDIMGQLIAKSQKNYTNGVQLLHYKLKID